MIGKCDFHGIEEVLSNVKTFRMREIGASYNTDTICSQNLNHFTKHSNNVFADRKLNIKSQSMADLKFNQFMARVVDVISKWKSRQMRRRIPYQWFTKNIPP